MDVKTAGSRLKTSHFLFSSCVIKCKIIATSFPLLVPYINLIYIPVNSLELSNLKV